MARRDEAKWFPILEDARRTRAPHTEVAKRHGVTAAALKHQLYRDRQRDKQGAVRMLPVRADDTSSPGLTVQIGSMSLQFARAVTRVLWPECFERSAAHRADAVEAVDLRRGHGRGSRDRNEPRSERRAQSEAREH